MLARDSVQGYWCHGCEEWHERGRKPGPPPRYCPDSYAIHKQERERERRQAAQARKLAGLPETVSCALCGKPVEDYRRGRPGGVPKYCRRHAREISKQRNRQSAARSYQRRKANSRNPRSG